MMTGRPNLGDVGKATPSSDNDRIGEANSLVARFCSTTYAELDARREAAQLSFLLTSNLKTVLIREATRPGVIRATLAVSEIDGTVRLPSIIVETNGHMWKIRHRYWYSAESGQTDTRNICLDTPGLEAIGYGFADGAFETIRNEQAGTYAVFGVTGPAWRATMRSHRQHKHTERS